MQVHDRFKSYGDEQFMDLPVGEASRGRICYQWCTSMFYGCHYWTPMAYRYQEEYNLSNLYLNYMFIGGHTEQVLWGTISGLRRTRKKVCCLRLFGERYCTP